MEFKDFEDKDKLTKFILQEIKDTLEGGITSRNLTEFRNTYVINAQDSLDATYPLYVPFNIISEMVKIVSVKISFWILPFRAYSTTVPSGGGHTTASGGGSTSGASGSASGGGSTSGSDGAQTSSNNTAHSVAIGVQNGTSGNNITYSAGYLYCTGGGTVPSTVQSHTHSISNHTHSTPNHTHPNHTHSTPAHTHAVANHAHDLTFGIYEEDNSPTIKFYISENAGVSYDDTFFGGYTEDQLNVEITSLLEGSGSKLLKFTSSARARLSVQVEIKLDIQAR